MVEPCVGCNNLRLEAEGWGMRCKSWKQHGDYRVVCNKDENHRGYHEAEKGKSVYVWQWVGPDVGVIGGKMPKGE